MAKYSINSTVCYFHPKAKRPSDAFCISCYVALPQGLKDRLNGTYGGQDAASPDRPIAYMTAWKDAARWLQNRNRVREQEATIPEEAY